jgi:hypothetical protein
MPTSTRTPKRAAARKTTEPDGDTRAVFDALRAILSKTAAGLSIKTDTDRAYYLESPIPYRKKPLMYGAVVINKSYVSYHFFPVYMFPELLDGMSPALAKRMQGKACFNFRAVDADAFAELAKLTRAGLARFRKESLV